MKRKLFVGTNSLHRHSKDMETFATGLKRIRLLCIDAGVKFEFQKEEYGFTVVFYRHCGEGWGWSSHKDIQNAENNSNGIGTQSGIGTLNGTLNGTLSDAKDIKERIKMLICDNPKITRKEIGHALSLSERSIQRLVNDMPDIIFVGKGKNGYWEIRK